METSPTSLNVSVSFAYFISSSSLIFIEMLIDVTDDDHSLLNIPILTKWIIYRIPLWFVEPTFHRDFKESKLDVKASRIWIRVDYRWTYWEDSEYQFYDP